MRGSENFRVPRRLSIETFSGSRPRDLEGTILCAACAAVQGQPEAWENLCEGEFADHWRGIAWKCKVDHRGASLYGSRGCDDGPVCGPCGEGEPAAGFPIGDYADRTVFRGTRRGARIHQFGGHF